MARGNIQTGDLSPSARRVQAALQGFGLTLEVVELPASARTSAEAAAAIGCAIGQIAKSLVFRGIESGRPILVIASGANRVDEARLSQIAGEPVAKGDADFVRQQTGFAIGGVPPVGHASRLDTYLDADLWQHTQIWAAAGTPHAVFRLVPDDLVRLTSGQVIQVEGGSPP
jgi:prolyl-tRNA editing enzyme YbaK/EbsC (Cys-tRNA(Pro) deacylase)